MSGKWEEAVKKKFPEVVMMGSRFNGTDRIFELWLILKREPDEEKDEPIREFIREMAKESLGKDDPGINKIEFFQEKKP